MPLFQRPAIGLDISDQSIEAVFVVKKGNRAVLVSYGRTTIPQGMVTDGVVQRRDELSVVIRKLLADQMTPPLPKGLNRVVFALPDAQVYSHVFEVPRLADDAELARSLAYEADGHFPYNHQDLTSGSCVINLRPDKKDIFYAAVQKEVLRGFLNLFMVSGLEPVAIEEEATSIARACLFPNEPDPVCFMDIGGRVTNLSIFDRNGIQFSETLSTAGDAFTDALSRAMAITTEDAESMKRNVGLSNELDLKADRAFKAEIDKLLVDIREAIAFYERRSRRLVKRVVTCGGSMLTPGLLEYISGKLSTPQRSFVVELADPWLTMDIAPILEKLGIRARGVLITTAIGLGLRGAGIQKFSEINFLTGLAPVRNVRGKTPGQAARPTPSVRSPLSAHPQAQPLARLKALIEGLPHWLKAALLGLIVLAAAVGVWLAAFRFIPGLHAPKAAAPAPAPASGVPASVSADLTITLGAAFSLENSTVPVKIVDASDIVEQTVVHAATKTEGKASGSMRIINTSGSGQTLVATTRVLSEQGILFRLNDRVFVPAGGTVTVQVTADQPGDSGDVAPGRFTIPGLSQALQSRIYGETDANMTGGVAYSGAPLSADELQAAETQLAASDADKLFGLVKQQAGENYLVYEELTKPVAFQVVSAPQAGTSVGDYALKLAVTRRTLAIPAEDLNKVITAALQAKLTGGTLGASSTSNVAATGIDWDAGTGTLTLSATAPVAP